MWSRPLGALRCKGFRDLYAAVKWSRSAPGDMGNLQVEGRPASAPYRGPNGNCTVPAPADSANPLAWQGYRGAYGGRLTSLAGWLQEGLQEGWLHQSAVPGESLRMAQDGR